MPNQQPYQGGYGQQPSGPQQWSQQQGLAQRPGMPAAPYQQQQRGYGAPSAHPMGQPAHQGTNDGGGSAKKSGKDAKAQAKAQGKKAIKPIGAGKGFLLGLLAAFIVVLIFSGLLIFYSAQNDASRQAAIDKMVDDALITIQDAQTNVTLSPAEGTMQTAIASNANITARTGGDNPTETYGAGVIWSSDGNILTNNHVIDKAEEITVTYNGVEYDADVVGTDPTTDLAVIKIDAKNLTAATLADSTAVSAGDWVMCIGNPYGLNDTVTSGVVSQTGRDELLQSGSTTVLYANMIQTDAAINPGSSGGGLYNAAGQLVGITTIITSSDDGNQGIGYAIPVNYTRSIATDIINGDEPRHADMGVTVGDVSDDEQQRFGLEEKKGASVQNVVGSGPAANAGIVQGDIITDFGGLEVEDAQDLRFMIRSHQVGDSVDVKVLREGHEMTMQIRLGADV